MKNLIKLSLILLVVSCSKNIVNDKGHTLTSRHYPKCSGTVEQKATFVLGCIKNANPKSDEEPEDWMPICRSLMNTIFCIQAKGFVYDDIHSRTASHIVPCEKARTKDEKYVCGY